MNKGCFEDVLAALKNYASQLSPEQHTKVMDKVIEKANCDLLLQLLKGYVSQLSPEHHVKVVDKLIEKADCDLLLQLLKECASQLNPKQISKLFPHFEQNFSRLNIGVFRSIVRKAECCVLVRFVQKNSSRLTEEQLAMIVARIAPCSTLLLVELTGQNWNRLNGKRGSIPYKIRKL
jgi:hypothetical protein